MSIDVNYENIKTLELSEDTLKQLTAQKDLIENYNIIESEFISILILKCPWSLFRESPQ